MSLSKNVLKILLFLALFSFSLQEEKNKFRELIEQYLSKLDINEAYLSYNQYISLLEKLKTDYPNYFELSSIGKTFEGNDIPLIIMKSPLIKTREEENNITSGIFYNGMHHGREPVSMMMNIYLILHLLSLPKDNLHLFLSITNIYFVPIINIDTYKFNSEKYAKGLGTRYMMTRKNRRNIKDKKCKDEDIGIDLNRNYDYFFGKDNEGSSNKPCQEDYRGELPFSEPETKAIKDFVDSHPDIKIVFNYHTWGNLIITPFNCLSYKESEDLMKKDFPLHYKMYQDFNNEAQFPINFLFGNADITIKYKTNGDATDWFLGKKKILSFSPELGNGNKNSDYFYPNKEITFDVLDKNLKSGLYAIQKSMFYLKGELLEANYFPCTNRNKFLQNKQLDPQICSGDDIILEIKSKIINRGYADYKPYIEFPNPSEKNETDKYNTKYYYIQALDLSADFEKIKAICYYYTVETLFISKINKRRNLEEKIDLIRKPKCIRIKNKDELENVKLFIDNKIKSLSYLELNVVLIIKRDDFLDKIYPSTNINNRFLNMNNTKNKNETTIVKIYSKDTNIIKSQKVDNEIIEWKFNSPYIEIKIKDLKNQFNSAYINYDFSSQSKKILLVIIMAFIIMIISMIFIIKNMNRNRGNRLLINGSIENNTDNNIGMNIERVVNNLENANQNNNNTGNNQNVQAVQIPMEENEVQPKSNSNSPNQLVST